MVFLQIFVDFQSISIDFWSFSTSFSQFQSILINFNQFQSVWLSQKRRNLLTTGRWGKQHLMNARRISASSQSCYLCFRAVLRLVLSERGQLSQAILQFHVERMLLGEGQKGTPKRGREEKRQKMSWQTGPLPLEPHFVRGRPPPLPLMSSEVQERGELAREVRGPKEKTNGRERDALSWHFLSRPLPGVPLWPSPSYANERQSFGLPCLQKCVVKFCGEMWFEIWNLWCEISGEIWG